MLECEICNDYSCTCTYHGIILITSFSKSSSVSTSSSRTVIAADTKDKHHLNEPHLVSILIQE